MEDPMVTERICNDIARLVKAGKKIVVVHGGGKEISRWLERVGLISRFIEGLRYTDSHSIEVIEMVLSGKINKNITSLISSQGINAVGLSGKDADLLICEKIRSRSGEDLGSVGEVKKVNCDLLIKLLENNITPIISCIGKSADGETLNINADVAAGSIAQALNVDHAIFLTDVDGVMKDGKVIPTLTLKETESLIAAGVISGGMIPKVENCLAVLNQGVKSVMIVNGAKENAIEDAIAFRCGTRFSQV